MPATATGHLTGATGHECGSGRVVLFDPPVVGSSRVPSLGSTIATSAKAGGSCFTLATRLALANLDFNILLGDEIKLDDPDGPDPDRQPLGQRLCILLQSTSRLQSTPVQDASSIIHPAASASKSIALAAGGMQGVRPRGYAAMKCISIDRGFVYEVLLAIGRVCV
uniref:Uncharacterized protein n=1 Tax=Oryza meridionalis TaxID=40149 RepID=A0A0E0EZN5_9ORYZ